MKFGWLHDHKNDRKWAWCRERRAAGRTVGMNWYSTDAETVPRTDVARALAANFGAATAAARQALGDAGVIHPSNHFVEPVGRDRLAWTVRAIEFLVTLGCDAVLLDPDTGVSKGKVKRAHAAPVEVAAYVEAFHEVAVFQHVWQGSTVRDQQRVLAKVLAPVLPARSVLEFSDASDQHFLISVVKR